ncbi:hypothetical protein JAAARDRAFT_70989 [Jaapia argillacea MUCL 33604]|uniref:Uncharacterized protein n=1 Tax=Jaapia argillacea MUCL 33604 TaxID=933084 RepID=A0A067PP34_9AGAM|nr:hypothetical protein JAAARDRAFT_70989 [Jaapia argillacea MUCL 33604]
MTESRAADWVPLWPNLSSITLLDFDLDDHTSLTDFLRERSKINRPIHNIRIDASSGREKSTNALRKLVEVEEIDLEEERRMVAVFLKENPDCWYE